ncbi:hypothetical protein CsSME_00038627 [Camellia sinensis var. sinensis]
MVLGLKGRVWGAKTKLDLIIRDILGRAEAEHVVKLSLAHTDCGVELGLDEQARRPNYGCI